MPPQDGSSSSGNGGVAAVENGQASNGRGEASVPVDWERLARATAHPLRVSILEILGIEGGRTLSPSDLSHELQIPLSNTNYHVTELAKSELIELVDQRQVRGATEHFYRLPIEQVRESRRGSRFVDREPVGAR
ncbi:MAG TPA: helix-turn-helix domain-containing protein [Solirubrobacterales bacterium]|jgi:DNA-binding transcriptional ArsR family regulator|nr:helix-turn-helix domain-containing protein [Solirubrobacterales bacterium]